MRIAICDDDEQELAHLAELITEYQLSRRVDHECHFFHNSTDFLCEMQAGKYDLILLDIIMPGINGVQAARELRELDKNVRLIFISSSPEFALESYSVGAYYYLLKPADANSLFPLLDNVGSELSTQKEHELILKNRKSILKISFAKIEYIEVINKTVFFHLADDIIHEVAVSLADIEKKLLSRTEFFKTHRSYLINLNYVQSIDTSCIITKNGHNIPISRQRRNQVQNAYMEFLLQAEAASHASAGLEAAAPAWKDRSDGPWQILLVDDEPSDRAYWADILELHGCIVQFADNGADAVKMAAKNSFDCVLLDILIPGEDGFSICEKLRKLVRTPVIFLSCLTESDRQIKGFTAGGIEYITKDTPPDLFWAKVNTRIKLSASDHIQVHFGPLVLDLTERKAIINGKELSLTHIEFDILQLISENTGHIFTPEEIFTFIWGSQPWDDRQIVQIHMSRLRRKLDKAWEEHHFIETVWGQGYRFAPVDQ